ncbi:MAG: FHIPEP family type III secretion protein [Clostridiales bacterium]|nr:FHIPEP family type III secretion protein [Clostridiales bacterium]
MLDLVKIGNLISLCRKDKGYTQDELASRVGVTAQAVSKWERGLSVPDTDMLPGLSRILDISIDNLLAGVLPEKETVGLNSETNLSEINIFSYLLPDEVLIRIAVNLCVSNQPSIDLLLSSISMLRKMLALEYGIILPVCRIMDDSDISDGEYAISFGGKEYGGGIIQKGMYFTGEDAGVSGIPFVDFNANKMLWITEDERDNAQNLPFCRDGLELIRFHLYNLVLQNPEAIITRQMVKSVVDNLSLTHPVLVSEVIPSRVSYRMLKDIFIGIIHAKKPVKNLVAILETADKLIDGGCGSDVIIKKLVGIL